MKLSVLVPCDAPKFTPLMVTNVPTAPKLGDRLAMLGGGTTVKLTPLLIWPPTETITFPVVTFFGAGVTMAVSLQLVGVATTPLKLTVLVPWEPPKLDPVIVTGVATPPEVGDRLVMLGGGNTVKLTPLLVWLFTVTAMFPVAAPFGTKVSILVSLQLEGAARVPSKLIVLVPWDIPKLVPVIVTGAPTAPEVDERPVMAGITPKATPALV